MNKEQVKDRIRDLESAIRSAETDLWLAEGMDCTNMIDEIKNAIRNTESEIRDLERQL